MSVYCDKCTTTPLLPADSVTIMVCPYHGVINAKSHNVDAIPCRHGATCVQFSKGNCLFTHPSPSPSPSFNHSPNPSSPNSSPGSNTSPHLSMSTIKCKFGDKCTFVDSGKCLYKHSNSSSKSQIPCKHGLSCWSVVQGKCQFKH